MYKIIGSDKREYGPVTAEQLRQWIAEGRANAQTQVKAEDGTEWKPLSTFPEFADVFGTPSLGVGITPPSGPVDANALAAQILARGYQINIGTCLGRGWHLLMNNIGLLLGATFVVLVIELAINMIGSLPRSIFQATHVHGHVRAGLAGLGIVVVLSLVSLVATVVTTGPLNGGLFWLFLRKLRGEVAAFEDVFAGFRRRFTDLILLTVVRGLLGAVCVLPGAILLGLSIALTHTNHVVGRGILGLSILLLLAGFLIAIYLGVSWVFALPLVIDKQLGFWNAMQLSRRVVSAHWWRMFGFLIVCVLVVFAGLLACCVGLLVSIPLVIATIMYAYEDIFGPLPTAQGN
jgi:uncharacterized membrane protein